MFLSLNCHASSAVILLVIISDNSMTLISRVWCALAAVSLKSLPVCLLQRKKKDASATSAKKWSWNTKSSSRRVCLWKLVFPHCFRHTNPLKIGISRTRPPLSAWLSIFTIYTLTFGALLPYVLLMWRKIRVYQDNLLHSLFWFVDNKQRIRKWRAPERFRSVVFVFK